MTRKSALKTLALLYAGFAGRYVYAEDSKKPTNSITLTEDDLKRLGDPRYWKTETEFKDIDQVPTGFYFKLDQFAKIEVEFHGKKKTISPQELFDAL